MASMNHHELTVFFLSLGLMLLLARILGELAKQRNQPAVLGEIFAGIMLGPTLLGRFFPEAMAYLFPKEGAYPIAMQAVTSLAITLFLLVAGMEIDLSVVFRQGKSCMIISFWGMVIPFAIGFLGAWVVPRFLGFQEGSNHFAFCLFLGTALAISALPVIAKTLFDLNMYQSDLGMIILSVAVVDDLIGWMLFAVILGMIGAGSGGMLGVPAAIVMTISFTFLMLTVGRWFIHKALPLVQAFTSWPGGVLGVAIGGGLLCAAFTEWIGIHSIFGAFVFGVALGDSSHLRERTRSILDFFISFIFAPLFFASIGLRLDFATHFSLGLTLFVIVIACAGKFIGCGVGSRLSGFTRGESLAIASGMNARGAMEIILALVALNAGLIGEKVFVALVIMALVTSMAAGGLMQKFLKREKPTRFFDFLSARGFVARLKGKSREEAIRELAEACLDGNPAAAREAADAAWQREQTMPTGIGHHLAVPHARLPGLKSPIVAIGLSREGIDFDAPDGKLAHIVCLLLTKKEDYKMQLNLLADIAKTFRDDAYVEKVVKSADRVQFIALVKSEREIQ